MRAAKDCAGQTGVEENGTLELGVIERGTLELRPDELSVAQLRFDERRALKSCPNE